MANKTGRKISGGRYIKSRKKKLYESKGQRIILKLADKEKRKIRRTKGGKKKVFLINAKFVNVTDKNTKKTQKIEIKNVFETPSNRFLARQKILTKGTIVQTELGKVKITNKPSQEGIVNGVLVE